MLYVAQRSGDGLAARGGRFSGYREWRLPWRDVGRPEEILRISLGVTGDRYRKNDVAFGTHLMNAIRIGRFWRKSLRISSVEAVLFNFREMFQSPFPGSDTCVGKKSGFRSRRESAGWKQCSRMRRISVEILEEPIRWNTSSKNSSADRWNSIRSPLLTASLIGARTPRRWQLNVSEASGNRDKPAFDFLIERSQRYARIPRIPVRLNSRRLNASRNSPGMGGGWRLTTTKLR